MAAPFICRTLVSFIVRDGRISVRNKVPVTGLWRNFTTTRKTGSNETQPPQSPETTTPRDPFPVFSDNKVQELLYRIIGFDAFKIAGPHKKSLRRPVYKLLTDAELAQELEAANIRMRRRLQMPPYMSPHQDDTIPLSVDPDLANFDTFKYVFTDISFGVRDRARSVVVRETDGTLKVAPLKLKERMNQIYNPRIGREYITPKIFEEENIERMVSEQRYLYILNRACCQFEPDDPDFIRVTHRVYHAVNEKKQFHILRSTRHFGSLAFYLAWNHTIDYLLLDMINRDMISDALDLVCLYCIIHPGSQCSAAVSGLAATDPVSFVKAYIDTESKHKAQLELALQAMLDALSSREKSEDRSTS